MGWQRRGRAVGVVAVACALTAAACGSESSATVSPDSGARVGSGGATPDAGDRLDAAHAPLDGGVAVEAGSREVRVCEACVTDAECPGGVCVEIDGAGACTFECRRDDDCPEAYVCAADGASSASHCVPPSGSCACRAEDDGIERTCRVTNARGTCLGVETCDADVGWSGCDAATPAAEQCNGEDDDCDFLVDDDIDGAGDACTNRVQGVGSCRGVRVCAGGKGFVCQGPTPEAETCDYADDDCDGEVDEEFKDTNGDLTLDGHCGACGNDCEGKIANGTGRCAGGAGAPACVVDQCDSGFVLVGNFQCVRPADIACSPCASDGDCAGGSCIDLDGQQVCVIPCTPPSDTCTAGYSCADIGTGTLRCVPDTGSCTCDGSNTSLARGCRVSNAEGTCYGQESCTAAGWAACSAPTPAAETCDGADDDCNGVIDDLTGEGAACNIANANGTCPGVRVCAGGAGFVCQGPTPEAETCDYADNDCDGEVDEPFLTLGDACSVGVGACQRFGVKVCKQDGTDVECGATAASPAPQDLCDHTDDDCDGDIDEAFLTLGEACANGVGACQRFGVKVCKQDGTDVECSATAASPAPQDLCDYADDDCDGDIDEGFLNPGSGKYDQDDACGNCFTDCTAIFDGPHAIGSCDATAAPTCVMTCQPDFYDMNGVPDDGCEFAPDAGAIYVSETAGVDDGTCGTSPFAPCASIAQGIARAVATARSKVLVADGVYPEAVTLQNGVSLLGGHRADTWERHLATTQTVLSGVASDGPHQRTVIAAAITAPTVFQGFVVYGPVNGTTSGNSYAVYVSDSGAGLEVRDNVIYAGSGGPGGPGGVGTDGAAGGNGIGRASDPAGYDAKIATGAGACDSANNRAYANGGLGSCGLVTVNGGNGGGNTCPPASTLVEQSAADGASGLTGLGGVGGDAGDDMRLESSGTQCALNPIPSPVDGFDGVPGQPGPHASAVLGCSTPEGSVSLGHWIGGAATAGDAGDNGGGGGGGAGGGGAYCMSCTENKDRLGGHGGGGGAGGCGGEGGVDGSPGGGSFGVFVVFASPPGANIPAIVGNTIHRGFGGAGGSGGPGGVGGPGGKGAAGGESAVFCTGRAGRGGDGGNGGHGGGGGGGCGGGAYGIYASGQAGADLTAYGTDNAFASAGGGGTGGYGGGSGAGGNSGGDGLAGVAAATNF